MLLQRPNHLFDGQANDVVHGAFEVFDERAVVFLRSVGAGLVEGMNPGKIGVEVNLGQRTEFDPGGFHEAGHLVSVLVDQTDAGEHLVNSSGQGLQHGPGFGEVGGFAEREIVEGDDRIGAQNDVIGEAGRNFQRLAFGVDQAQFPRGEVGVDQFLDAGGLDPEGNTRRCEQLAPPG